MDDSRVRACHSELNNTRHKWTEPPAQWYFGKNGVKVYTGQTAYPGEYFQCRCIAAIAECDANPEFSIRFSVKDGNTVSEQLLVSAVENATAKARVLAKAAGIELGGILCIDYSWGELRLFSETEVEPKMMACMAVDSAVGSIDIEPKDVDVSDSVTVVWSIGGAKCSER